MNKCFILYTKLEIVNIIDGNDIIGSIQYDKYEIGETSTWLYLNCRLIARLDTNKTTIE